MNGAISLQTSDGVALEARWDLPTEPRSAVVFCHPHPQHGGTMRGPLMHKVTTVLVARGLAVLRFNFRGVGQSQGTWDEGVGEVDDVASAVAAAHDAYPKLPRGLMGWSFGAVAALRWQAREGDTLPYVGIAPPVSSDLTPFLPVAEELSPAPRTFIIGDRDQFTSVDELETYARSIGAGLEVLRGSDHFFYFREEKVGTIAADSLLRGVTTSDSE